MKLRSTPTLGRNTAAKSYETWLKILGVKKSRIEGDNFVLEFNKPERANQVINRFFKDKGISVSGREIVLSREQLDIVKEVYASEILKFDSKAYENLIFIKPAIDSLKNLLGLEKGADRVERAPLMYTEAAQPNLDKGFGRSITLYIGLNYKILSSKHIDAFVNIKAAIQSSKTLEDLKRELKIDIESDDLLEIVRQYFKQQHLEGYNALVDDMRFAFAKFPQSQDDYAQSQDSLALLERSKSQIMELYKEKVVNELQKVEKKEEVKADIAQLLVKQHEMDRYPYMHVREDGSLTIMVPFTGGELISTDNTCKTGDKFTKFSSEIKSVINLYIADLIQDIALLNGIKWQEELLQLKQNRLKYLEKCKKFFEAKNDLNLTYIREKLGESNAVTHITCCIAPRPCKRVQY